MIVVKKGVLKSEDGKVLSLIPFGIITGIYGTNYVDIICFVLMLILVFLKAITIFLERKDS